MCLLLSLQYSNVQYIMDTATDLFAKYIVHCSVWLYVQCILVLLCFVLFVWPCLLLFSFLLHLSSTVDSLYNSFIGLCT